MSHESEIKAIMKAAQIHLVVATLLMTVTFAAGFTLPGGFDSNDGPNKGMAILTRKAAFRAFVVTDAIAFTCSAGAIFTYYSMAVMTEDDPTAKLYEKIYKLYGVATFVQLFAMVAVVIAFVTVIFEYNGILYYINVLRHSWNMGFSPKALSCRLSVKHAL